MSIIAYIRVSTFKQDVKNQRYEILEYAQKNNLKINEFIELEISSRKTVKERGIEDLYKTLQKGDMLIVSEMSRLGRSLGQVINIIDTIVDIGCKIILIKQNLILDGRKRDIGVKAQIALFGLLAELERDLISDRTKAGLENAKRQGKKLGRPKGVTGKSKLEGKEEEIKKLVSLGVTKSNIAKITNCAWGTVDNFIKTRL